MATLSLKYLKRCVFAVGTVILLYLLAALAGSIIPANQQWQSPDHGIQLFIETNGLHTGIVLPIQSDVHDWSHLIRPEHLTDPTRYGSHILIGWGHEGVYRNTQDWKDLRVKDAISAVFGSTETLVHIYHLKYPQDYPHYRRSFEVSEDQYRKLVAAILPRFALDLNGRPEPSQGYGTGDLFYKSQGHYSAFYTCNNWTSDVLRQAGIRAASWSPFQGGVMRWFPENP